MAWNTRAMLQCEGRRVVKQTAILLDVGIPDRSSIRDTIALLNIVEHCPFTSIRAPVGQSC